MRRRASTGREGGRAANAGRLGTEAPTADCLVSRWNDHAVALTFTVADRDIYGLFNALIMTPGGALCQESRAPQKDRESDGIMALHALSRECGSDVCVMALIHASGFRTSPLNAWRTLTVTKRILYIKSDVT